MGMLQADSYTWTISGSASGATDLPASSSIKLPKFIAEHVTLYVLGLVGVLVWGGATAYLDTRHVQREEFHEAMRAQTFNLETAVYADRELRLLDKIDEADAEIERLQLYNRLGSANNQPARDQVIIQTNNRKEKWKRELELLEQQRPDKDGD